MLDSQFNIHNALDALDVNIYTYVSKDINIPTRNIRLILEKQCFLI